MLSWIQLIKYARLPWWVWRQSGCDDAPCQASYLLQKDHIYKKKKVISVKDQPKPWRIPAIKYSWKTRHHYLSLNYHNRMSEHKYNSFRSRISHFCSAVDCIQAVRNFSSVQISFFHNSKQNSWGNGCFWLGCWILSIHGQ